MEFPINVNQFSFKINRNLCTEARTFKAFQYLTQFFTVNCINYQLFVYAKINEALNCISLRFFLNFKIFFTFLQFPMQIPFFFRSKKTERSKEQTQKRFSILSVNSFLPFKVKQVLFILFQ